MFILNITGGSDVPFEKRSQNCGLNFVKRADRRRIRNLYRLLLSFAEKSRHRRISFSFYLQHGRQRRLYPRNRCRPRPVSFRHPPSGRHLSLRYPRLRRPHRRRFQDQPHRNQRRRCRGFGGRRRHCAGELRRAFRRQHSPAEQRRPSHEPRRSPCQHHLRSGQNAKHRFQPRRRSVSKRFDLCGPKIVLSSINAPSPPT